MIPYWICLLAGVGLVYIINRIIEFLELYLYRKDVKQEDV